MLEFFKNKNLQKRLWFTLFAFLIYRFGCTLVLPGINSGVVSDAMASNSFLSIMSMMSGGSEQFSIFALGVMPYITASIIIQLLSMDVIPYLTELAKSGQNGRTKLDNYTKYLAVVLGIVQAISIIFTFNHEQSNLFIGGMTPAKLVFAVIVLLAGMMWLVWLSGRITDKGLGNGMSMIIMAGIVGRMPGQWLTAYETLGTTWKLAIYILCMFIVLVGVTLLSTVERRIPVQYTSTSVKLSKTNNHSNYLPFKLNPASVIPVIFASSLMLAPLQVLQLFTDTDAYWYRLTEGLLGMKSWASICIYGLLVWFFTFFYTQLQTNPENLAENLQKSGAYIPEVRPGKETYIYVNNVLSRTTVLGAIGLTAIAVLPHIMPLIWTEMPQAMALGGTGLIIVVGVALETTKQIRGILTQNSYRKYYKVAGLEE